MMIPAVTPIPLMNLVFFISPAELLFPEIPFDQPLQGFQGFQRIFSLGLHRYTGSLGGGQHHQIHDAFAVGLLSVFVHFDLGVKPVGRLHERSGGSGMKSEFVPDNKSFGYQGFFVLR
jgi:hypothetical protein